MKRLLTPIVGTSVYLAGTTLTGGRDYVLVQENDDYANMLILQQRLTVLATGDKAVMLPEEAQFSVLEEILTEHLVANKWNPAGASDYEEHLANAYRFAAESYTSELNGGQRTVAAEPKKTQAVEASSETATKPTGTAAQRRAAAAAAVEAQAPTKVE